MIRNALLLCAALLTALCFACAPQTVGPPQPRGAGPFFARSCSADDPGDPNDANDPGSFVPKVVMLAPNFVPTNFGNPPASSSTSAIPAQVQADLKAAFFAAPGDFRTALCGLTGVYIDPTNTYSWGYRDPTTGGRYIGLSEQSLWGSAGATQAPIYSTFETSLLRDVMAKLGIPWPQSPPPPAMPLPPPPTFSPASPSFDTAAMTVTAALAHEFGHVLWYDAIKRSQGAMYDPTQYCYDGTTDFFTDSWDTVTTLDPWVHFAEESGDLHAKGTTQIYDIKNALANSNPPMFKTAARLLNSLYDNEHNGNNKSGMWSSLFAAVSPEEDFVETFKFYIMTRDDTNNGQPLTSMALNIYDSTDTPLRPKYTPNLYGDYHSKRVQKKKLTKKVTCIDDGFSLLRALKR